MVLHLANSFAHQLNRGETSFPEERIDLEYLKKINMSRQAEELFDECKKVYNTDPA